MELTALPQETKNYIEEVQAEMKRVTWPSWKQVRATTGVVIAAVFLFAAYFFLVDYICAQLINRVYHSFAK